MFGRLKFGVILELREEPLFLGCPVELPSPERNEQHEEEQCRDVRHVTLHQRVFQKLVTHDILTRPPCGCARL